MAHGWKFMRRMLKRDKQNIQKQWHNHEVWWGKWWNVFKTNTVILCRKDEHSSETWEHVKKLHVKDTDTMLKFDKENGEGRKNM